MKTKISHFLTVLLCLLQFTIILPKAEAVTAYPNSTQYKQADGSVLTILMHGDEFVHWATTIDGYTIMTNSSGSYEYATTDGNGYMVYSGIQANNPKTRSVIELNFLNSINTGIFFSAKQLRELKDKCPIKQNYGAKAGEFPTTGVRKLLLILANFADTAPTYTQVQFDNYMNQVNYNGTGSFRDFFIEASYGQLTINTTVTAWVNLPRNHDYYGPQAKWKEFAFDACTAANPIVNFSQFDNDVDGDVDAIAIIHQGRAQEESGNIKDIWSHSSSLVGFYTVAQRTMDGVVVGSYTAQPELYNNGISNIGTMCHEFGHTLGAPDFYDTDYATNGQYDGTGRWDLQAGGSWNGAMGTKPAHPNPYTKCYIYNWAVPTVLSFAQSVTVNNYTTNSNAIYRYNTSTANEYFIIENRQQTGFNIGVPGHGLIIYHVDGSYINSHSVTNEINIGSHQGLYPVCADAAGNPIAVYGTINSGGCPFPGTGARTSFTDATTPHSHSWAGANTNFPITNIVEGAGIITFCFISCPPTCTPPTTQASNFSTSAINNTSMTVSWTRGNGTAVLVVAKEANAVNADPFNGTAYIANAAFGSGTQIGTGNYVVYRGTGTSVNITGLTPNTKYYYAIYEYFTADNCYNTSELTGNGTTTPAPFDGTFSSGTTFPHNSMTVINDAVNYWMVGTNTHNGAPNSAYITNNGSTNTYDNTATSVSHFYFDYNFPAGQPNITLKFDWKGAGENGYDGLKVYLVPTTTTPVAGTLLGAGQIGSTFYNQQGNTYQNVNIGIGGINAGTTKRIVFTWVNDYMLGTNPPIAVDNIIISTAACIPPNIQASVFTSSLISENSMTVGWTRGNGDAILVVARQGSAVNADPTDGTSYIANSIFGSGSQIGAGNYVIYNGTGTFVNVSGLIAGTAYHYAIYEYNSVTKCYNMAKLIGNATTLTPCTPPTSPAINFTSSLITRVSMTVGWTRGNGTSVLVVARAGSAVNANPANGISYFANNAFVAGSQIGTGNYVVYNGTGTSVNVIGLTPNTTYYYAIYEYFTASNCYFLTKLTGNATTQPASFDGTFSSGTNFPLNGMTTANDLTNYWIVGTNTHNGAPNAAFITSNGANNTYNKTVSQVSHFYFDYNFPAGQTDIMLSFDYKSIGEASNDILNVYLIDPLTVPTAGVTLNPANQIGSSLFGSPTYQNMNIILNGANAGNTKRIVFSWINNASLGIDPPAAVDNIQITTSVPCVAPTIQATSFIVNGTTPTSANISWTRGNGNNVLVIAKAGSAPSDPVNSYTYLANNVYGNGSAVGGGFAVYNGNGTNVNVTGLIPGTYYFAIYEYNSSGVCYNKNELTGTATPAPTNLITTIYNFGGTAQLVFDNSFQYVKDPVIRVSATAAIASFNKFQVEINTDASFAGVSSFQQFTSGPYTVGTQYNLTCNLLSPALTFVNNTTYYLRVRASEDSGNSWGSWSTPISYTYKSPTNPLPNSSLAQWYQTTYYQFSRNSLFGVCPNLGNFVEMSPSILLTKQISASTDDAYDDGTTNFNNSASTLFGKSGLIAYTSGFRFNNLTIPKGAIIESAILSGYPNMQYAFISFNGRISADNVDNSGTFATLPSLRASTALTVDFNLNNTLPDSWMNNVWYDTPDISPIVQSIVNRAGWTPGNSMSILIRNNLGVNNRGFYSWDGAAANAPKLIIKYTNTSGGTITSTPIYYSSFVGASMWKRLYWSEAGANGDFRVTIQRWFGGAWVNTAFTNLDYNANGIDISALGTEAQIRLVGTFTYAGGGCPKLLDWTVSCEDVSTNQADLVLSYNASNSTPCMGTNVCYTISCSNDGPKEATNIVITSAIPAGLTLVNSSSTIGNYSGSVWSIPAIQVGETATLLLYATVNAGTGGSTINSTATITSLNQIDPDLSNNSKSRTLNIVNNNIPTISLIPNQITNFNTPTGAIPFTIGDMETPLASLTVSGFSSNTNLIPNGNIIFGGSGANRTVTVTPGLNQYGTCTITIDVGDATCNQQRTFLITVRRNSYGTWIAADIVVGQANFTSNSTIVNANTAVSATSSAVSVKGVLAVGSQGKGRILLYNTVPNTNGVAADVVVGKLNMTDAVAGCTQNVMKQVDGVAFSPDGNKLICSEGTNNRVLIWNTIPTSNGTNASVVLGQTDFTSSTSGCSSTKFNFPCGIFVSPNGMLYVCDNNNHRVLVWNSIPTVNNTPADMVIGQLDFTTNTPGNTANKMNWPWYCALSPEGKLAISEQSNNRILIFNTVPTQNGATADVVMGQENFGLSGGGLSSSKLKTPTGLTISPSGLTAVGEFQNERVMVWDQIPTTNGKSADFVLGQIDFAHNAIFSDATGAPSTASQYNMYSPYGINFDINDRLFVNGREMNRLLIFGTLPTQTANLAVTISNDFPNPCIYSLVNFTIIVTNSGPNTATNVVVSTSLPVGFTFISSTSNSGSYNNSGGLWSIPCMAVGQSYTLTVTGMVNFGTGGKPLIAYAAIRSSNQADSDFSNNSASTVVTPNFLFAPQISNIVDQSIDINTTIGPVPFTVHSEDALPLTVTTTSSNQLIVKDANIIIGGTGDDRTFTITPEPNKIGIVTITITVSNGNSCNTTQTFLLSVGNIWLGYTIDWHTLSNWSRAIPRPTSNAYIPTVPVGGYFPLISAPASALDIVMESGSTLSFDGTQTLSIYGNWINDGTVIPGNGTVIFNGTSTLSGIGNYNFYNLSILAGKSLTAPIQLNVAGSWACNGTFVHNSGIVVYNGSSAQLIKTNANKFYNLTVNNTAASINLQDNTTVVNTLKMTQGNIGFSNNAYYLELGTGVASRGTLDYTSGVVIGKFKRWFTTSPNSGTTGVFPIGVSANYRSATIEFTSSPLSGGSLTAEFITTLPVDYYQGLPFTDVNGGNQYINTLPDEGFWQIDAGDGLNGGTYKASFVGNGISGITDITQIRIVKRSSAGGNWTAPGFHGSATTGPYTVSRTGLTGFSQFAYGGFFNENPLPVELISFTLKCDNTNVNVNWSTATETNNDYFTLERSVDGIVFIPIVNVKGAGNSNMLKNYAATDPLPYNGSSYYRLKQTDYDGKFKYLETKSVNCEENITSDPILSSFPNPFNNTVYFEIINLNNDNFIMQIMDVLGNIVETKSLTNIENNKASLSFDMSDYSIGVYFYRFTSGNFVKTGKIIKD